MRIRPFDPINDVCLRKIICRFLLVSLNIDAILGEVTIGLRRKKLEEMARGNGLSDAYTETLTRLKGQKGNKSVLGLKVLKWVLYSERPLRAEELCHALAVEMGSTDLDSNNIPVLRTLLSSCLGLVTVEGPSSTVRLVHFTLLEHLLSNPTLFHSPHSTIAEVCLTYLNFECVRDLSPTLVVAPSTMPLLEYSSIYWGEHARMGMTENAKILALRLLDRFDEHISAQLLLLHYKRDGHWCPNFNGARGPTGFTGLHGVAFLGIVEMVAAVLEIKKWDINATDCMGSTALIWAARKGHEEVVKMLLDHKDVNPNQPDTNHRTRPISWAAAGEHEGVVKTLLEREDVNPNPADTFYSRAPLSRAAENGHEGLVKMFLARKDVDPNQADPASGRTPLSWAAENGHEGVAKMLLEQEDVDLDRADTFYGRTPLSLAAENGHEGVVEMLLEREDINPDQADAEHYQIPIALAAENGHEGVVKMLLEREDINPNRGNVNSGRADDDGQQSLPLSTVNGDESVAETQPRHNNPNTDTANLNTQPALPSTDPTEREGLFEPKDPLSKATDRDLAPTEPSKLPQPPSMWPPNFRYPSKNTNTYPINAQSTISLAVHRYFIIASLLCLFAFLIASLLCLFVFLKHFLPSSLPHIFPFHK